ncbi:hypothetical protein QL285_025062 [Trifolium repens]|nr:hypothetical protein QL285_025062 [Trifolium repens]
MWWWERAADAGNGGMVVSDLKKTWSLQILFSAVTSYCQGLTILRFGSLMDCNKEEALRAKAIAEKKMESRDFVAAQKLYPVLENIAQMLVLCEQKVIDGW